MNTKIMQFISNYTGLQYDGSEGDNRLHYDNENINVFIHLIKKSEYNKMIKDLNKTIKGKGYTVYAWNDVSGFDYWTRQGQNGDSNYIQVSVDIQNLNILDIDQLKKDSEKLFNYFLKYDNVDQNYHDLSNK